MYLFKKKIERILFAFSKKLIVSAWLKKFSNKFEVKKNIKKKMIALKKGNKHIFIYSVTIFYSYIYFLKTISI